MACYAGKDGDFATWRSLLMELAGARNPAFGQGPKSWLRLFFDAFANGRGGPEIVEKHPKMAIPGDFVGGAFGPRHGRKP